MDHKLKNITLLVVMAVMLIFSEISVAQTQGQGEPSKGENTLLYVCPMHPHIHGGPEDNCPICGMPLVLSKVDNATDYSDDLSDKDLEGSYRVDTSLVQKVGIKTAPVNMETFGDDIRAYGRVVPSSRVASNVTLRVEGWIENFVVSAAGDPVEKGQRLFDLNSPQLMSAQTDYMTALQLGNKDIASSAASRLRQLGVDQQAMQYIKKQNKVVSAVPFYASSSGIVTNLNIRTGDYVKAGQPVFSIQDLSTVWVEADVPERNLFALNKGDRVVVEMPETSKKRFGEVTYIQPTVNPNTRTGKVRIELSNSDGSLKPDAFVDVTFTAEKRQRIAVPVQAVLRSSMGDYVLRWLGDGRFKPVMVTTGVKSNEFVEIRDGLAVGYEIVASGQFLLDAEANLKSGMGVMSGHNHDEEVVKPTPESSEADSHAKHK